MEKRITTHFNDEVLKQAISKFSLNPDETKFL
jgi:hypothetical protein